MKEEKKKKLDKLEKAIDKIPETLEEAIEMLTLDGTIRMADNMIDIKKHEDK
jgi:hypothetical protein